MKNFLLMLTFILANIYGGPLFASTELPTYLEEGGRPARQRQHVPVRFAIDNVSLEEAVSTNIGSPTTADSIAAVTAGVAAGVTSALVPERGRVRTGGAQPSSTTPAPTSTTLPPPKQLTL